MQERAMPIRSRIKILLYERNLDLVRAGKKPISIRKLAEDTNITHSALVKLVNGKSSMVSFETIDKLMKFFGTEDINQVLEYIPDESQA